LQSLPEGAGGGCGRLLQAGSAIGAATFPLTKAATVHINVILLLTGWRCSSVGQSMRLISAGSGVQIPAPPPFLPLCVSNQRRPALLFLSAHFESGPSSWPALLSQLHLAHRECLLGLVKSCRICSIYAQGFPGEKGLISPGNSDRHWQSASVAGKAPYN
jgi:hypothetical protein